MNNSDKYFLLDKNEVSNEVNLAFTRAENIKSVHDKLSFITFIVLAMLVLSIGLYYILSLINVNILIYLLVTSSLMPLSLPLIMLVKERKVI